MTIKTLMRGASAAEIDDFFAGARQAKSEPGRVPAADAARATADATAQIRRLLPGQQVAVVPVPAPAGFVLFGASGGKIFEMDAAGTVVTADWLALRALRDEFTGRTFPPGAEMGVTLAAVLVAVLDLAVIAAATEDKKETEGGEP